jgi:hypothetical protein
METIVEESNCGGRQLSWIPIVVEATVQETIVEETIFGGNLLWCILYAYFMVAAILFGMAFFQCGV